LLNVGGIGAQPTSAPVDRTIRVAAIQMRLRTFATEEAYATTINRWVARAVERKVDLVVFPEDVGLPLMLLGGGPIGKETTRPTSRTATTAPGTATAMRAINRLLREHRQEILPMVKRHRMPILEALSVRLAQRAEPIYRRVFADAARRGEVIVAAGSCPVVKLDGARPRVYNAGYVFDATGQLLATTLKVNPVPLERSLLSISPATHHVPPVFDTPAGRLGMAICYDCYFPDLIAQMGRKGMQILVDPRADPNRWTEVQERISREKGLWQRVQENVCYGIECFGVGGLVGISFEGRTLIVAPAALTRDGTGVLARARSVDSEELIVADLDLAALNRLRRSRSVRQSGPATTKPQPTPVP